MSKHRKPSPNDFAPLLAQASQRIDDAITSLNDAAAAAAAANNTPAKAGIHRLVLSAMALSRSAQILAHPDKSHGRTEPQPPNPTAA